MGKYTFKQETDLEAFENFVLANGGIYMQSAKWAQVKLEWNCRFYSGFDGEGSRVLTALVMERHIPAAGRIWYSPAGPVCDYANEELFAEYAAFIKNETKAAGVTAYFIDPCIELRVNGEPRENGKRCHDMFVKNGFTFNSDASRCLYKSPLQLIIDLKDASGVPYTPEKLLKSFEKGVRYSVRVGEQRGLIEKIYTIDDVNKDPSIMKDFMAVMHDTSERSDFVERGDEYDKRLMTVFGDGMDLMLIYYDKNKDKALQEERLKRKAELEAALPTAPEKKIRGIKEEIDSIDKQTEHYEERVRETANEPGDVICVAGGMTVHYNGMASCLFGGAKNLLRNNLRASHYFNFRRICHSIEKGHRFHDLGYVLLDNVPPEADGTLGVSKPNADFEGILAFKKSFGSDTVEYVGEYALVTNKVLFYSYSHLLEKAREAQSVVNRIVRKRR